MISCSEICKVQPFLSYDTPKFLKSAQTKFHVENCKTRASEWDVSTGVDASLFYFELKQGPTQAALNPLVDTFAQMWSCTSI